MIISLFSGSALFRLLSSKNNSTRTSLKLLRSNCCYDLLFFYVRLRSSKKSYTNFHVLGLLGHILLPKIEFFSYKNLYLFSFTLM